MLMIRFLPFLILLLITRFLFAQGTESFINSNLSENFTDGSFASETTGVTIGYQHCRDEGDYPITDKGIMLRRNDSDPNPSAVEFHIPNGVGEFTFQYRKAFTGSNNRILSVSVNNEEVFLSPIFGNVSGLDDTIYSQTIPVNKQGNVVIRIAFPSSIANGNRHVTIDNVSWTKALNIPTALQPTYISVDNFISTWGYSNDYDFFEIHVSDFKNRILIQTESFEYGLDTSGYEELWEAELIGGRWILDNVLRTTQHVTGDYGAQLQADYGKLISPIFNKPKSVSFYAKKGVNDTNIKLSMKIGNDVTDLHTFPITNTSFQYFTYHLQAIPDEASFIFTNGARVLYLDDLLIESEGFIKLPVVNSPFQSINNDYTHHIKNLEPNTKYFYSVRVNYENQFSGFSDEVELITKDGVVWDGLNWQYGLPTQNKVVVLRGDGDNLLAFQAKSLKVEHDLEIPSGTTISLNEEFENYFNHSIIFNEGAYLIQDNDNVINYGNATFKRNASFFGYDSKFWSSPVINQSISSFIENPSAVYKYNESGRNWLRSNDDNFNPANGYVIQMGTNYPFMGQGTEIPFVGLFTGVPNNGEYTIPATKTTTGLGDNGVGNPYGSPIAMSSFMSANPRVNTLYFWNEDAHYVPGSNPPSYQGQTWFSYNLTGSNYDSKNHIGPGVGFIARVSESTDIIFNNSMRENIGFNQVQNRNNNNQKDRFWLSLNFENNKENQILIGYVEGATNGIDEKYDAKNISNRNSFILSHANANAMIIEGRQYPLDINDQIPLYFRASKIGEFTIKLEDIEGVFNLQPIYLIDNDLDLSVNLNEVTEYTFDSELGNFTDRFEIRYQPKETLNLADINDSSKLVVYKYDGLNKVTSKEKVTNYKIYDLSGRLIFTDKINHLKRFTLPTLDKGTYIVNFTLENGEIITKKVFF